MFPFKKSARQNFTVTRKNTGETGENLAVEFLIKRNCIILHRNYRKRFGEIDIIVRDGADLVFVEVKTRRSQVFGSPYEAVNHQKQKQISKVALSYLSEHNQQEIPIRFDVVAVYLSDHSSKVELIKNAFEYCD